MNGGWQPAPFTNHFRALTGFNPLSWQSRLFRQYFELGRLPSAVDIPTGLGKTAVMALWLIARAEGASMPRRLVYVVDRRAVVDQATEFAVSLRANLEKPEALELKRKLGLNRHSLPISTLRGQYVDNREWLEDPTSVAIVVATVDMAGSRLLFEGYGVSRKMRPYHAGLLGIDALIVLDEAHLTPPFGHLLRAIEQDVSIRPIYPLDRMLLPPFAFLPLSATQRNSNEGEHLSIPFRLERDDWTTDCVVKRRLEARKRLRVEQLAESDQDNQLARAAWTMRQDDLGNFLRVIVFCDRRDKQEDGRGPSAQGVKEAIERLANGDRKAGRTEVHIHPVEMLVGARRVHERTAAAQRLCALGFIGEKKPLDKPAFLVATSAGEVGVDIDADHMVSDLVAWERMVQRFGRVNRRGEGDAEIKVFWSKTIVKDTNALTDIEKRALTAAACMEVIENLPRIDDAFDVSPAALRQLAEDARKDATVKARTEAATTPEPLRPALNRALVDAWSMTSLEAHTGRPDVAPWLHGWVDERPQTTILWRAYLPVRVGAGRRAILPDRAEMEEFFEAAPPHESEKLETESYRAAMWLQERGSALLHHNESSPGRAVKDENTAETMAANDIGADAPSADTGRELRKLRRDDIAALILTLRGDYAGRYSVADLAQERRGKAKDEFHDDLVGKVVVVDARVGGINDGLLDPASENPVESADDTDAWSKDAQFRVRRVIVTPDSGSLPEVSADGWRFEADFDRRRDDEGKPLEQLIVEHFGDAARKEDARSISKPQELSVHQEWTRREMSRIVRDIGLSAAVAQALAVGASLHDEGKKAPRWQRAFKASRDAERFGLAGPLAKTRGPIDQAILGGYRHEFGSVRYVEENAEFKALPDDDWRELVLHLVAAHHGQARPMIDAIGCEDGPPSLMEARQRDVALRFARLQKRWGPWGLAWWEALLRAADQEASRNNEEGQAPRSNGCA